jgi:uncharacterized protein YecE (DUF72 family)
MKKWWIGCSGFYYKGWREKFYPKGLAQRKWFEYYCESFNTVELNVTFYRFPTVAGLRSWYARSPDDFRFTVKAPRLITHYKRFHNATKEARDFYSTVRKGLKDKVGTVLFQLHPGIAYSTENLERILSVMDESFHNVIEFRHPSWWNDAVLKNLRYESVSFCGISYPSLPDDVMKSAPIVYYRFHGVPKLYKSSYSNAELKAVVTRIKSLRGVSDVYAYFNNDIDVAAVANAKTLMSMIK